MSHDGVASVDDGREVAALVEHAEIHAHDGGVVYVAAHGTLVRADDHQMIAVGMNVGDAGEQLFEHLIGRHQIVKAHQRDGVLHTGVVSIEGDDVGDSHALQLLQSGRAVERLAVVAAMLTAAVEDRHDHVDPVRLAAGRLDDTLEILKMVVGRHHVFLAEHGVGAVVVAYVHHDEQVHAAHAFTQHTLAVARRKARAARLDQKILRIHTAVLCPAYQIAVDFPAEILSPSHGYDLQRCDASLTILKNGLCRKFCRHFTFPSFISISQAPTGQRPSGQTNPFYEFQYTIF